CLGRRPAPYVYLTRRPSPKALDLWGPVFAGPKAREAVRRLNDYFGLRDCPEVQQMIFAEAELFPMVRAAGCIRHEIGTCLGPCAAACTRDAYEKKVHAARAFLDGVDSSPLQALREEMAKAAAALAFERAAVLREKLAALDWLQRHLERVRKASKQHHFIYPVKGHGGRDVWYLLRHGWVAAALATPRDAMSRKQAALAIEEVYQRPKASGLARWEE